MYAKNTAQEINSYPKIRIIRGGVEGIRVRNRTNQGSTNLNREALDGSVGQFWKDRCEVVAYRDTEPTAAFDNREDRSDLRSGLSAAYVDPIFLSIDMGRMDFSAMLLINSSSA